MVKLWCWFIEREWERLFGPGEIDWDQIEPSTTTAKTAKELVSR